MLLADELLDVDPAVEDADAKAIRKKYRSLALKHHPDKARPGASQQEKDEMHTMFVRLSAAYEVLSDPRLRNRYDKILTEGRVDYADDRDWTEYDALHGFGDEETSVPICLLAQQPSVFCNIPH